MFHKVISAIEPRDTLALKKVPGMSSNGGSVTITGGSGGGAQPRIILAEVLTAIEEDGYAALDSYTNTQLREILSRQVELISDAELRMLIVRVHNRAKVNV